MKVAERDGLCLRGSGVAFPETAELENTDVYRRLLGEDHQAQLSDRGWDPEHPRKAWGVERRRWSAPSAVRASEELAARAAQAALDDAGIGAGEVDLLVASTSTPGRISSSMAGFVCERLGLRAAGVDLRAGGTGGVQAWTFAATALAAGARRALVVAAETPSQYLDHQDLAGSMIYGDGAAALLLERAPDAESGLVGALSGTFPAAGSPFTVPGDLPPRAEELAAGAFVFQAPDAAYRSELAEAWRSTCEGLREAFPRELAQTRHFLPYAVTREQVDEAARIVGIDAAHSKASLAAHGCTGCAGPLIGLHELRAAGALQERELIATCAIAGGISWCSLLWRL